MRRLLLILILLLPLASAAQDESDKDFLTRLLERSLSGRGREVVIEGFSGALGSEARIDRLAIHDDTGPWLVIDNARLQWDRRGLLSGRIDIETLAAESLALIRWPNAAPDPFAPEATPFALPDLPVAITVGTMDLARVAIGPEITGKPVVMALSGQLGLGGGEGSLRFDASRIDGETGSLAIDARFANATDQLGLFLELNEGAGGIVANALGIAGAPPLRIGLSGEGLLEDFKADLVLESDNTDRLGGSVGFGLGDTDHYELDLKGDVAALVLPDYRAFFGSEVALTAKAARQGDGRIILSALSMAGRSLTLEGTAALAPDGWPETINLRGLIADPTGDAVLLPLPGPPTRLSGAELTLTYDASKGDAWTAGLRARNVDRPGMAVAVALMEGKGTISASAQDGPRRIQGQVSYEADGVSFADKALSAALGARFFGGFSLDHTKGTPVRFRDLSVEGPGLSLAGTIDLSGAADNFAIRTEARLAAEDLERFAPVLGREIGGAARASLGGTIWPTDLSFDLRLAAETRDLSIGRPEFDSLLAGEATGSGRIIRDRSGMRIEGLEAHGPAFAAKGAFAVTSQSLEGDLSLDLADLGLALSGLDGPAALRIKARQDDATATVLDIAATGGAETVAIKGIIPETRPRRFVGSMTAAFGDLERLAPLAGVALAGRGETRIDGEISLDLADMDLAARATTDSLGLGNGAIDPLVSGAGELAFSLRRAGGGAVEVPALSASTPGFSLSGSLIRQGDAPAAVFRARIEDMARIAPEFGGPLEAQGRIEMTSDERWVFRNTSLAGPGGLRVDVAGSIAGALDADLSLSGVAPVGLLNQMLEPRRVAGMARFDLRANGALDADFATRLTGSLSLEDGRLAAPTIGQSIEGLGGTVIFGNGAARIGLDGRSTYGGAARLSGSAALVAPYSGDLALAVEGWRLRDPALYATSLDGEVTIRGPLAGGAMIAGEVRVGKTELRIPSSSIGSLGEIPAITQIAAPPGVLSTLARAGQNQTGDAAGGGAVPYGLDIRIFAPEQIFVRGRGLDAELGGSLTLQGTTADVVPVGQLGLIRGRLDILQQRFDLTEGTAAIRGDLLPEISLTATTTAASGTIVHLTVEGHIDAPEFMFASSPELPQDEIISQLLFGRGIDQISPLQAVRLASAVSSLAGRGAAGVVDNLRQRFGLDDLDIGANPEGETTFRVGKYLGENLYTDVSISSGGQSEISLNLDLSDTLTAKGSIDSEGQSSLGIFFERDY